MLGVWKLAMVAEGVGIVGLVFEVGGMVVLVVEVDGVVGFAFEVGGNVGMVVEVFGVWFVVLGWLGIGGGGMCKELGRMKGAEGVVLEGLGEG